MDKRIWLLSLILALAMVGCGKKTEEPENGPAAKETPAAPTPIDPATVGEVTGKITFAGTPPKPQQINMDQDPTCEQKNHGAVYAEDGQVNPNGTLPNAFVYVKAGAEKYVFAPTATPAVLDQNGCMYKPHVLGIMAGQILKNRLLPDGHDDIISIRWRRTIVNGICRNCQVRHLSSRSSDIPRS